MALRDIGDVAITDALAERFTLHAVYGILTVYYAGYSRKERCFTANVKVVITHIGGYPGHYDRKIAETLRRERPQLSCAVTRISQSEAYDQALGCLHINPRAAGKFGFHTVRTAARFEINGERIENLELIELKNK